MNLIELVYMSRATHRMSAVDLLNILDISRHNNLEHNVTGMLLYRDGHFIQLLEGEAADVEFIFSKIEADTRHTNILLVVKEAITVRSFGDWSMGFNNLDLIQADAYPGYTDFLSQPLNPTHFVQYPTHTKFLLSVFKAEG